MAVTSIWPIKGRVDNVIKYAMNPEKTTADLSELHAINGVVEYASNELKTEKRMFVTCIGCTSEETAAQEFMEWWLTLSLSILTGLAGLLLAFRPSEAVSVIMTLLGVSLLTEGILSLSVAISLVKIVNNQMPDVIDVEYYETEEDS